MKKYVQCTVEKKRDKFHLLYARITSKSDLFEWYESNLLGKM